MTEHDDNAFPPVVVGQIGREAVQTVNARDLHDFLQVGSAFKDWIVRRIADYGFQEDRDFCSFLSESQGGRPAKEYAISIDMAKELSMVERNERGKEARRYFIRMETRAKQAATIDLSDPAQLVPLLTAYAQRTQIAEAKVAEMTPKAAEFDAYISREGVVLIRDFCNKHGVKVRHPGYALRARNMMHQRKGLATQVGIKAGIIRNIVDPEGFEYENSKGDMIEAQAAMIVKEREADLLQMILDDYGQTAFRNPTAFQRAKMLLSGGGLA